MVLHQERAPSPVFFCCDRKRLGKRSYFDCYIIYSENWLETERL